MKVDYKNGAVTFELCEILQYLTPEQKLEMMEFFACDDVIIKHVTDQIVERWTENSFSGDLNIFATENPTYGLDWAWREVAKRSGEVAKREIERLEKSLEYSKQRIGELLKENKRIVDIYHRNYG